MKKFEQMEGTQNAMNIGVGAMSTKIGEMATSANVKFESIEKRLDKHDLAINEIKNVRDGTSGGGEVLGSLGRWRLRGGRTRTLGVRGTSFVRVRSFALSHGMVSTVSL